MDNGEVCARFLESGVTFLCFRESSYELQFTWQSSFVLSDTLRSGISDYVVE
ncbi:unnamed protein product [Chondrus crispus]|uniref:Uncharacterized protein n=1 Tax=Chondrus crispus TaxID=2769 RepID=R7Q6P7_CHOCR|nr:unnamed protein product [Chondrus crispus]CDF33145.1 unnamed protein product [Chondrus crispus]|eukprot:XP_005712948.1 unnamed protein product [Chondrus crispus]